MTTLETNTAPVEASGEGTRTPEKAVRWAIPLSLLACVLLAFFDKISIAALFSDTHFQQAMGIDFDTTRLGILMSAFLLSYGFSSVFLSGLGDKIAPLRLLTGMMAVWCVLMVAMGFTHNYTLMIVLRILLGVAEGPLFPLAFAIVRHNFPQHLQARATMLWLLGTPVGAAIGFPLSLWLLNTFGWQSTFFVMAMLTVPVLIFVRIGGRGIRLEAKPGTSQASRDERRAARRELFVSPHFWIICIFNIAFLTYLWGINGWLPGYLIKGKGIHLEHAGTQHFRPAGEGHPSPGERHGGRYLQRAGKLCGRAVAGGDGRAYRLHPQHGFRADFSGGDGGGGLRPVTAAAETLLRRVS